MSDDGRISVSELADTLPEGVFVVPEDEAKMRAAAVLSDAIVETMRAQLGETFEVSTSMASLGGALAVCAHCSGDAASFLEGTLEYARILSAGFADGTMEEGQGDGQPSVGD